MNAYKLSIIRNDKLIMTFDCRADEIIDIILLGQKSEEQALLTPIEKIIEDANERNVPAGDRRFTAKGRGRPKKDGAVCSECLRDNYNHSKDCSKKVIKAKVNHCSECRKNDGTHFKECRKSPFYKKPTEEMEALDMSDLSIAESIRTWWVLEEMSSHKVCEKLGITLEKFNAVRQKYHISL